jgi:hypothetical protein
MFLAGERCDPVTLDEMRDGMRSIGYAGATSQ